MSHHLNINQFYLLFSFYCFVSHLVEDGKSLPDNPGGTAGCVPPGHPGPPLQLILRYIVNILLLKVSLFLKICKIVKVVKKLSRNRKCVEYL